MINRQVNLKMVFLSLALFFTLTGSMGLSEAHILIIGNSTGDFPLSYQETSQLAADLRANGYSVLDYYGENATTENILKGMYGADAVIYDGHGAYKLGNYDGAGGTANPPFALIGADGYIWGVENDTDGNWYMQEGNGSLFTAPFRLGIPVFLLHTCFSTGWVGENQVANPIETIYNFAQMFDGTDANYYATAWNGAEIIYDFLNGASNFQDANNQNTEKIVTSTLYNGVEVWRNDNGYAAFVGDWNGVFPSVSETSAYDEAAADAWYNSDRQLITQLFVDANIGNDSWDGTSPVFLGGTTGPMKTITTTINTLNPWGTIYVASGIYNENLVINKEINLIGSGVNTIINPLNAQNPLINITSEGSGSVIIGFILNGTSSSSAVAISGASSCTIANNNITGNQVGVLVAGNNNVVYSNQISDSKDGVYLGNETEDNIVFGNQINNSTSSGVYCEGGNNHYINNNTVTQSSSGITVNNSKNVNVGSNQVTSNTKTGVTIKNSNNTTITDNNISSNQNGVEIGENSNYNTVSDNTISENQNNGINIDNSQNNQISHNTVQNNVQNGINLNNSSENNINNGNNINGSDVGINIENNSNSNIINGNTIQAATTSLNIAGSTGNIISDNEVTFSINEIITAANMVKASIETSKTLPSSILIGFVPVNMAQFLHLAVQATIQLNNNENTLILMKNDKVPGASEESLTSGGFSLANYVDFAGRINDYMNDNLQAPPYGYISLGQIGYQSQVYLFSRILSIYNDTGALPTAVTVKPWTTSNIPINEPTAYTIDQILETANNLKTYIEINKKLPTTVTIGTQNINLAQFLYLATKATAALKDGQPTTTSIMVGSYSLPSTSYENLKTGALTTGTYVDFANRISQYIAESSQAPAYGLIGLGQISYQSQVYLYSRVLVGYGVSGQLPDTMTVKAWSSGNIPIYEPSSYSFTVSQIVDAAQRVKAYVEANKALPSTVTMGSSSINMGQFLFLAITATNDLDSGKPDTTVVTVSSSYGLPGSSYESMKTGALTTGTYVDFANRIAQYMAENYKAPPYGLIGLGQISYQSQVYLYSRVLAGYGVSGQLPDTMTVKAWSSGNMPIYEPSSYSFTVDQVLTAAQTVKNYIETNKKLPSTVTMGSSNINMAQFLFLAVTATNDINNGKPNNTTVTVNSGYTLPASSSENLKTGIITTTTYVDFANRIGQYMAENYQAPPYGYIGLGQIGYQSQIYLYSCVLNEYNNYGSLPANVMVEPLGTSY